MNKGYSRAGGFIGNSFDVNLCDINDAEIRADVIVRQFDSQRLWGQVVDCDGMPVPNALLKLIKVTCSNGRTSYQGIAHTVSDCQGFYQFDLCPDSNSCYKILVGKSITGSEAVLDTRGANCNPCRCDEAGQNGNGCYNPCPTTVNSHVVNYQPCLCNNGNGCWDHNAPGCASNTGCNKSWDCKSCSNKPVYATYRTC